MAFDGTAIDTDHDSAGPDKVGIMVAEAAGFLRADQLSSFG